jgi:hypothetical protein
MPTPNGMPVPTYDAGPGDGGPDPVGNESGGPYGVAGPGPCLKAHQKAGLGDRPDRLACRVQAIENTLMRPSPTSAPARGSLRTCRRIGLDAVIRVAARVFIPRRSRCANFEAGRAMRRGRKRDYARPGYELGYLLGKEHARCLNGQCRHTQSRWVACANSAPSRTTIFFSLRFCAFSLLFSARRSCITSRSDFELIVTSYLVRQSHAHPAMDTSLGF